jgi:hypothetical protein
MKNFKISVLVNKKRNPNYLKNKKHNLINNNKEKSINKNKNIKKCSKLVINKKYNFNVDNDIYENNDYTNNKIDKSNLKRKKKPSLVLQWDYGNPCDK